MINKIKNKIINIDFKSMTLYKNVFMSLLVKGLAIIVSFVNMPIFIKYFKNQQVLGLWFAILSMLNWILTFDFGIGNGLRNYLVISLEKKDNEESSKLITSAYCSIGLLMIILSVIIYSFLPIINWNSAFNISTKIIPATLLIKVLRILLIGIFLQFFLKIINTILYAMQKPAIPNFLLLISNSLLLIATFFLNTNIISKNLLNLSYAYIVTTTLPLIIATIYVFRKKLNFVKFKFKYWTKKNTKEILILGSSFLVLQLLSIVAFNTKEFFIMRFIDPSGVVPYQIYNKLFSLISTFFVLAVTPLWSAFTQAYVQKDYEWIHKTYKKGLKLLFLFAIFGFFVILLAPILVRVWLGNAGFTVKYSISILFALFNVEYMWISLHSLLENGLGFLKIQKLGYFICFILFPILSYLLVKKIDVWYIIVIANIISLLPLCLLQGIYDKRKLNSLTKNFQNCKK